MKQSPNWIEGKVDIPIINGGFNTLSIRSLLGNQQWYREDFEQHYQTTRTCIEQWL